MALDCIPVGLAQDNMSLEVEINGALYPAKVRLAPLCDPAGKKARGEPSA